MELAAVVLYLLLCLVIGAAGTRNQEIDDFLIGQRRIARFRTTMSLFATLATESLVFFAVALSVTYGPAAVFGAMGGVSAALVVLSLIAPDAHARAARSRFLSISEYCVERWGKVTGQAARWVFLTLMAWVVILQIRLNADLFSGLLNWPTTATTWITSGVVLAYLLMGGYRSVTATDTFQGLLLLALVFLPFVITRRPDLGEAAASVRWTGDVLLLSLMSFALTITRPELWQRLYSAATPRIAARSLLAVAGMFLVLCLPLAYYAVAIIQAAPGLDASRAFAEGYRHILPPGAAVLFPVILLAAMMSSLDAAAFLFAVDVTGMHPRFRERRRMWVRVWLVALLVVASAASLTIFNTLTFAYKINGLVAILTLPLLLSYLMDLPRGLVALGVAAGAAAYVLQIATGWIDRNPSVAILPALLTGAVLAVGGFVGRSRAPAAGGVLAAAAPPPGP
jgi:Na+/proline symporter